MKKIIAFLIVILLTGCTITKTNDLTIDRVLDASLGETSNLYNINRIGYRYYLPRTFNVLSDIDYNESFTSSGVKYYLYIDIISYYNKIKLDYEKNEEIYYSKYLKQGDTEGYLEITKIGDYFLIEMMYNYSKVEVLVEQNYINEAIIKASTILSSVKYNDKVISNIAGEGKLNFEEVSYDIFKPKNITSTKTFLDYVEEFDEYNDSSVEDNDLIN